MFKEQNKEIINSIINKKKFNMPFEESIKTQKIINKLKNEIKK